ncbi:Flp family type IVb pilin [Qipengyuania sp.]|uniref:Flp family type IVb pilin n=1 Tax=Qipengyuania sp. TaxID=2004515 RepID=UPI003735C084
MIGFLTRLKNDDQGATAVEYGLILALIFLALVGAVQAFGQSAGDMWEGIDETVSAAMNKAP